MQRGRHSNKKVGKRVQCATHQSHLLLQVPLMAGGAACVRGSERDRERAQASGSMWGAKPRRQAKRGNPLGVGGRPARGLRQQTQARAGKAGAKRSPRRGLPRFARAAPSRPTAGAGVAKRRKASYHLAGAASSRANAAKSPTGDRPKVGRMVPVGPRKMCIWRCRGSVADSDCGSDTLKTDRNQKQLQDVG